MRWAEGRAFSLVYDGGPSVHDVAEQAARLFLHENALNTMAFPSLGQIQSEVVGWTAGLLHGPDTAAGFLTSGGTESIQCAVLAARERGRIERGVTAPEIVVAESAHAAFHKSAHLFGMRIVTTPVGDDWTADVDAMADAVGPNTVLVVGSAPQYPQGVVDPIPEIAALAASVDANCHVDACMGGFVLPFAELLERDVPPWDFRVDGVHSISADIHKLGYAPKGVSVIVHRTKQLRTLPDLRVRPLAGRLLRLAEPAGLPVRPADGGGVGRDAAPRHRRLRRADARRARRRRPDAGRHHRARWRRRARRRAVAHRRHDRLSRPSTSSPSATRCGRAAGTSTAKGRPTRLHATVSNSNVGVIDDYLVDLAACVAEVGAARAGDRATTYATLE